MGKKYRQLSFNQPNLIDEVITGIPIRTTVAIKQHRN
jgi:hypothetical protein